MASRSVDPGSANETSGDRVTGPSPGPTLRTATSGRATALTLEAADVRPVQTDELSSALRLLLGQPHQPADDARVVEFMATALRRRYDLTRMWVAVRRDVRESGGASSRRPTWGATEHASSDAKCVGGLVYAALPLVQPGGVLVLLTPPSLDAAFIDAAAVTIAHTLSADDSRLVQVLVDPDEPTTAEPFKRCGFEPLATLLYLHRQASATAVVPAPPIVGGRTLDVVTYSTATHALFRQALLESYVGSQDCPRLSGVRDIEDVLASHRAAGIHDPSLWAVLVDGAQPAAAVLLSPTEHDASLELVYLGVTPAYRRKGLGRWCLQHAMSMAASRRLERLVVAVDADNAPAIKLYYRFGLQRFHRRLVMFRLSAAATSASAARSTCGEIRS